MYFAKITNILGNVLINVGIHLYTMKSLQTSPMNGNLKPGSTLVYENGRSVYVGRLHYYPGQAQPFWLTGKRFVPAEGPDILGEYLGGLVCPSYAIGGKQYRPVRGDLRELRLPHSDMEMLLADENISVVDGKPTLGALAGIFSLANSSKPFSADAPQQHPGH